VPGSLGPHGPGLLVQCWEAMVQPLTEQRQQDSRTSSRPPRSSWGAVLGVVGDRSVERFHLVSDVATATVLGASTARH
jgi:hypothetical protein